MKRWLLACSLWLMCVAAVPAHPVETSCTTHRHDVRPGDTAAVLARRDGVDAHAFANWLAHAGTTDRLALRRMRPGDHIELCVAKDAGGRDAVVRLRVQSDRAGRRRADQTPRVASLVGVRASVITTPLALGTPKAHPRVSQVRIIEPLPAGKRLVGALADVVGRRPVAEALAAYARHVWHLPAKLPDDSHYRLAMQEGPGHGRHHALAMVALEAHGRL